MNKTDIDYLDLTWNPLAMRCTRVSPACDNCWHLRMAVRKAGNSKLSDLERQASAGIMPPVLMPDRLGEPLRIKKPQRIGVQFMGDLFHQDVHYTYVDRILNIIYKCPQHAFLMLTKRAERMWRYFHSRIVDKMFSDLPLKNVWLGVTVENQEWADKRIPILLQIPAAKRFVSYEPALGPVDFENINYVSYMEHISGKDFHSNSHYPKIFYDVLRGHLKGPDDIGLPKLDLIITGGETGPHARPSHPDWFRMARDQAVAAGVPFFFKAWGEWLPFASWQECCIEAGWGDRKDLCVLWRSGISGSAVLGNPEEAWENGCRGFKRVGKKAAGRLLDGRTWEEVPGEVQKEVKCL